MNVTAFDNDIDEAVVLHKAQLDKVRTGAAWTSASGCTLV